MDASSFRGLNFNTTLAHRDAGGRRRPLHQFWTSIDTAAVGVSWPFPDGVAIADLRRLLYPPAETANAVYLEPDVAGTDTTGRSAADLRDRKADGKLSTGCVQAARQTAQMLQTGRIATRNPLRIGRAHPPPVSARPGATTAVKSVGFLLKCDWILQHFDGKPAFREFRSR